MELKNAKINFLGDSITQGQGFTPYVTVIKEKYGLSEANNCGIGGTRIAKQTKPLTHIFDMYFGLRAKVMPKDVDAVVVFGGTNDYGHGDSKMGDIDSTDVYTFYGALNSLITDLKTDYPNSKIVFLTPIRRSTEHCRNHNGKILEDYVNAIIDVTKKHNIPVIDLFRSEIFDPNDVNLVPDGLHPNNEGQAILADYIAKELIKI